MHNNNHNIECGIMGEDAASSYLEERGFDIIKRNYRCGKIGEIDIIAKKGGLLIFVEVKSRNCYAFGGPLYSVNRRKRNTIRKIASQFLAISPDLYTKGITCRFDMISVNNGQVEWVEDIIR